MILPLFFVKFVVNVQVVLFFKLFYLFQNILIASGIMITTLNGIQNVMLLLWKFWLYIADVSYLRVYSSDDIVRSNSFFLSRSQICLKSLRLTFFVNKNERTENEVFHKSPPGKFQVSYWLSFSRLTWNYSKVISDCQPSMRRRYMLKWISEIIIDKYKKQDDRVDFQEKLHSIGSAVVLLTLADWNHQLLGLPKLGH